VIRALLDFWYLAQAPCFTDHSLCDLEKSLQEFHSNKDAIVWAGARKDAWTIPKLELLQSVVPSIRLSGAVMQWSANVTEHAHVQEIKVPARAGNNQNYYSQIARYLDCSEKCFRFDLATHLHSQGSQVNWGEDDENEVFEQGDEHESYPEDLSVADHMATFRPISNYFAVADALQCGSIPTAIKLYHTFSTTTTAFHLASKPSLHLSLDEAAEMFRTSAKLWWNISIVWRIKHILYLEPEATTAHYPLTAFRYGTRSVRSKCNIISARFPMPRRRCMPCPPRHLALMAYTMQS